MAESTAPSEPASDKPVPPEPIDWQPIIDEIAPHLSALLSKLLENGKGNAIEILRLERWIIWLAFTVVLVSGIATTIAVLANNFDAAERIVIPLISFAGGLGVGSRLQARNIAKQV